MSAIGNALTIRTRLAGEPLLKLLNSFDARVFFSAATLVREEFQVRRAVRRVYRYFELGPTGRLSSWRRAAALFSGRIDVRSFGRGLSSSGPVWREIEQVAIHPVRGGLRIDVRAPSFVWGMVRKIIGSLREHDAGRLSLSHLSEAIGGQRRLTLPLAEPAGLVLYDVKYSIPWSTRWVGPNRQQSRLERQVRSGLWVRAEIGRALGRFPRSERPSTKAGGS